MYAIRSYYDLLLALAKTFFTLDIKHPGDIGTGAALDLLIGVIELHMQLVCQMSTNGTLARPHGTDEENIAFLSHVYSSNARY